MIDKLRMMAIFQTVVEARSFRGAAKQLKLSPSVVSHHISQLEKDLGCALLYRSTRKISLTEDGAKLFEASQKMTCAANAGLDALRKKSEQPTGKLRIAAPGALFEQPPYIRYLTDFIKTYPKLEIEIKFSDQKVELIGSKFDVAIRIGWLEDSQYKARKLFEVERVLVASPDYMAQRKLPTLINDLQDWDWIKLTQFPINRQLTNTAGVQPRITPRSTVEVDSVAALCQMAIEGLGVAAVPRVLVRKALDDGSLIALSPDWQMFAPGVYAVWPDNVAEDGLALLFARFVANRN